MPAKEKAAKGHDTLTAFKNNTHIQRNMNTTDSIATCARPSSVAASFNAKTQASTTGYMQAPETQPNAKTEVSGVSRVQAPIHAGYSRYLMFFREVSGVSARGIRRQTVNALQPLQVRFRLRPASRCRPVAGAGIDRQQYRTVRGCDTVPATPAMGPVRKNIVIDSGAFTHALSWVFSRPNTLVSGRDGLVRKAGRMAESMFLTSRPPFARKNADGGFQSHSGAKSMTTITRATAHTTTPTLGNTSPLARQQAIENALSMALHFIRHGDSQKDIHAATGRAIRAASMLKQACAEFAIEGRA